MFAIYIADRPPNFSRKISKTHHVLDPGLLSLDDIPAVWGDIIFAMAGCNSALKRGRHDAWMCYVEEVAADAELVRSLRLRPAFRLSFVNQPLLKFALQCGMNLDDAQTSEAVSCGPC